MLSFIACGHHALQPYRHKHADAHPRLSILKRKCHWLQDTYGSSNGSNEVASTSKKRSRESDALSANLPRRQNKTPDVAVSRKEVGIIWFPHSQRWQLSCLNQTVTDIILTCEERKDVATQG